MSAVIPPQQFVINDITPSGVAKVSTGIKLIETSSGERFGGYGWHEEEKNIEELLTRKEKKEIASAEALYRKGRLAELFFKYGTTNIDIVKKIVYKRKKGTTMMLDISDGYAAAFLRRENASST